MIFTLKNETIILGFICGILFFAFQARAADPFLSKGDVPESGGFRTVTLLKNLDHPWGMAWLPDGNMLVTERSGKLLLVDKAFSAQQVQGVPKVYVNGQAGLLDVTLHPDFSTNRIIYLSYAHGRRTENGLRVAKAKMENLVLKDVQVIFEVSQKKFGTQHFGSRFVWLPDKTLLFSVGDGGNPPVWLNGGFIRNQAQDTKSHLGKVLRMRADGTVPADNPFSGSSEADPLIWSIGHRNIQGLAVDPLTGKVWSSEHGALGGDELNIIEKGGNYGWPEVTYSREYTGFSITDERSRPGMINPKLVWLKAIAPSGLLVYTGNGFLQWQGDLFAGGLVSQNVRRIDLDANGNIQGEQSIRIGARVRDVSQGPDGMIYVLTDEDAGKLIRISPAPGKAPPSP
jgi:glucose/arabinose dehydrogenase